MSFTQATFNVHYFFQNVIPAPYLVDNSKNELVPNPLYKTKRHRKLRRQVIFLSIIGTPFTFVYLIWLLRHYNPHGNSLLPILYYAILFILLLIFNGNLCIVILKGNIFAYIITQSCRLTQDLSNHKTKTISVKELFVYGFVSSFIFLVFGLAMTPITGNFDPLQLLLGSSYLTKAACCTIYAYGIGLLAWCLLSTFVLAFSFVEMMELYTSRLILSIGDLKIIKSEICLMSQRFQKCYKGYKISRLLFDMQNEFLATFSLILICVGILLCSVTTTAMIKLYSELPTVTYLSLPAITAIGLVMALVFTYVAGIPYNNSIRFRNFWQHHLWKKYDQKVLKTCKPFGLNEGPYGICQPNLGLRICDNIIYNAVNLLLLFPN